MAIDITERQAVESRLREAQKLESLGVLASGVAHDFNSSLMVILGNTTLLRASKGLPPRALEHIQLIEEAGARADQLIRHLLTYARTGRHNPQRTQVNAVIRDALMLVRSSIRRKQELRVNLADGLPEIMADHSQLAQIVLNLCLNARDAMPEGGEIHITTSETQLSAADASRCVPYNARPGRYVELAVRDSGSGMDETTVRRMFDPFFTTKPEGHGLGMAAVLGILRQHSAAALVDSKLARGTTIRVFFPPAPPRNGAADLPRRTPQPTDPPPRGARPRRRK
jgi:signal transduction histidine kinase